MAMHYGILPAMVEGTDSETGLPLYDDRAVDEIYFSRFHAEMLSDGISAKNAEAFQVTARDTLSVAVKPGAAFIQGYFAYDDEETVLELQEPEPALSRLDRVVLRLDKPAREITLEVRSGDPGQSQLIPPALERNDDVWELCLAEITVPAGASAVTQANITDTRLDSSLCGITENPLGGVSDELFKQYDQTFHDWFSGLRNELDENQAANLLSRMEALETRMAALESLPFQDINAMVNGDSSYWLFGNFALQWGRVAIRADANTVGEAVVTYPLPFTKKPHVFALLDNGNPSVATVSAYDPKTTEVALRCLRTNATASGVMWFAIGEVNAAQS